MIKRITAIFLFSFISIVSMSAQTNVKGEFHYKNLAKYLNEAIELIEVGDFTMGEKKLNYAQKSMDKLLAKGFEADLQTELQQIKAGRAKIANPNASSNLKKVGGAANTLDIRSSAHILKKQVATIKEIFEFDPQYMVTVSPEQQAFAQQFNATTFIEKCNALLATSEIDEPKYKRQRSEVQTACEFVTQLTANATSMGVFTHIDKMIERMNYHQEIAEKFQAATASLIKTLQSLMPNNAQLKRQYQQLQSAGNNIAAEKKAAAAKVEAVAQQRAAEKAAAQAQAEKAASGLPVAGLRDASLEAEFKRLGQAAISSAFKIDRIIITASKWGVTKDAVGRPISRAMITYAIGRGSDGNCYKQAMTFTQNASGSGYGSTFYDAGWAYPKKKINCDLL
ncbi:MAG: hypothetical protein AB8G22_14090 [Saprospiraceae bacterium]